MNAVVIIPARYASSRYPGKPLAELTLPDGARKSLIRMSWEAACAVEGSAGIYVATDDARIREHCEDFGANVIMTDEACRNGTERCADALAKSGLKPDIIVNLQGDAPLTPPWFIAALIDAMRADPASRSPLRCSGAMRKPMPISSRIAVRAGWAAPLRCSMQRATRSISRRKSCPGSIPRSWKAARFPCGIMSASMPIAPQPSLPMARSPRATGGA
jgi:3-deoxy-manno-octulosonate cytidylyltransferase (CMP-KDO synthetase)